MAFVTSTPDERARRACSLLLQRLAPDGTQRNLAQVFGVSESTVSRWKEAIEPAMKLTAHLGLKVVDESRVCVPEGEIKMLRRAYSLLIEHAPWLLDQGDV